MLPVSIQARQALGKLVLPVLIVIACGITIVGQTNRALTEHTRMLLADMLAPAYRVMLVPELRLRVMVSELRGIGHLADENAELRAENARLRRWYDVAVALANENESLKASLHWIPDAAPSFVTGHAVRDAGGVYSRAVLLAIGAAAGIQKGDVALAPDGLVGRVTEIGDHSVRVLLITDISSRIPVTLASSHASAIMAGDNSEAPRLIYYPQDNRPIEGERVTTGDQLEKAPAGLPIGTVHYIAPGQPVVQPFANLDRLSVIRLFDYGMSEIHSPDAPGRVPLERPKGPVGLSIPFLTGRG